MNSRERVFRAVEFRTPDRVPRDLWPLPWTQMYAQDQIDRVLNEFPTDFTGAEALGPSHRASGERARKGRYTDDWGCEFHCGEDGVIGEVKHPPLGDGSALEGFTPPWEMIERADWDAVNRAQAENLASDNPRFMLPSASVRPFERLQFLRGTENLYVDIATDAPEWRRLRNLVHEFYLVELDGWAKTDCDGVRFMDDWGSQNALLISPDTWRREFKPLYVEYCDKLHAAGKKAFFHTDGCIEAIYGDLIEVGMDAINSQLFCMDIERLGREHKGRVTFWGEIDRQHVLPFGTVEDVRRAVGRVRRALQDSAGGVIAQCEFGTNVPTENVLAVFAAWDEPIESLPE